MNNLIKKKNFSINFSYLLILFLFSFFINLYYSKLGSFPIDTFLHYDSSSRILKGELPLKDYWIVSGLVVDVIQSLFFWVFGINWHAYTMHSSIFNSITAIIVYSFLLKLNIGNHKAFIYSISFSVLSYTISGTPFVDMHAAFFLLIATLIIIQNLTSKKNIIWFTIIFLMFLSFFSKLVPAAYAGIVYSIILGFYFLFKKDYKKIIVNLFSILALIIIIYLLTILVKIDLKSFYIQIIDYPRSIGSDRLINFEFNINSFFNKFKFIIIFSIILIVFQFKKKYSLEAIIRLLVFFSFIIIMIFHQLMTKNQIYIYFLIPLICGLIESEIKFSKHKNKKYFSYFLIFMVSFLTVKYHLRYNENRKFHELNKIQLSQYIKAEKIHNSLAGLYWKNPNFAGSTLKEITILKKGLKILNDPDNRNVMLISHYQFLDSITENKLNYPNRTFTDDGASMPLKNNKYFKFYEEFLNKKIIKTNVNKILFFKHENISHEALTSYFDKNCFKISEDEVFYSYKLTCSK